MADILEIFAPASRSQSSSYSRSSSSSLPDLPPFGINRAGGRSGGDSAFASGASGGQSNANGGGVWGSLAQEVMQILAVTPLTTTTTTIAPLPPMGGIFGNLADRFQIPALFRPLFSRDEEKTTTAAPPTTAAPSTMFPTLFPPLPTFPTLPPFPPPTTTQKPADDSPLLGGLRSLFDPSLNSNSQLLGAKKHEQIDTGGGKMDRFVVREHSSDPEDFWSNLAGNKWNERGIQWDDGNLRLVNKKGNKLLGSEVAVHDRSIDIPVARWFDIANDVLGAAVQQRVRD
ncbi:hypothetical protein M3Y99_00266600 [Aphelenchoides fujianensis]|nr:hypothetical protein M3Y99_00266600 [Aphelenchoides fujianensis]